jgi:hypothetical protein
MPQYAHGVNWAGAYWTGRLTGMLAATARFGHAPPENAVLALGDAQSSPQR